MQQTYFNRLFLVGLSAYLRRLELSVDRIPELQGRRNLTAPWRHYFAISTM
jgi:hypothetical protein